jgi:CheY-like chemotaxis protein
MKTTQTIENEATLQIMAAIAYQRDEDKRIALRLRADDIRVGAVECPENLREAVANALDEEAKRYP